MTADQADRQRVVAEVASLFRQARARRLKREAQEAQEQVA